MRLEQPENDGWNESKSVEIWHEVEHSDGESDRDGERQTDDAEADGEEYADEEGYECLSAEVFVHAVLDVVEDAGDEVALALWNHAYESLAHCLIVHKDEEEVDDGDEGADEANERVDGTRHDGEELWYALLEECCHVAETHVLRQLLNVYVRLDETFHLVGDCAGVGLGVDITDNHILQPCHLIDDGRYEQHYRSDDDSHEQQ